MSQDMGGGDMGVSQDMGGGGDMGLSQDMGGGGGGVAMGGGGMAMGGGGGLQQDFGNMTIGQYKGMMQGSSMEQNMSGQSNMNTLQSLNEMLGGGGGGGGQLGGGGG